MTQRGYEIPDIVVDTAHGLIFVEVKRSFDEAGRRYVFQQLRRYAEQTHAVPLYSVLVDASTMTFYRALDESTTIGQLETAKILQHYDETFSTQVIYESYLTTLVQSWLDDVALHWNSDSPPGVNELPPEVVEALAA
jgi:hypothetical protein